MDKKVKIKRNIQLTALWIVLVVLFAAVFRFIDSFRLSRYLTKSVNFFIVTVAVILGSYLWLQLFSKKVKKQMQDGDFRGAISVIEKLTKDISRKIFPALKVNDSYNLALCYFWLGEFEKTKTILQLLISQGFDQPPKNGKATFLSAAIPKVYATTLVISEADTDETIDYLDAHVAKIDKLLFDRLKGYLELRRGNHQKGTGLIKKTFEEGKESISNLKEKNKSFTISIMLGIEEKFFKGAYFLYIGNFEEAERLLIDVRDWPVPNCFSLKASELLKIVGR